ncbi:hypothetical protein CR513_40469, partial [Mucuna pruriens]
MEMSNLAAKFKSLELELGEDLIVHLVLISLPTHFGKFKVSYNIHKDKWSINALISHCVQEKERSFFEVGNARFLEEVEFEKEDNIKSVVFEEKSVNDISEVLVPIIVQETTLNKTSNTYKQPQQPQEVSLKRSIGQRRYAILDDYIVFL